MDYYLSNQPWEVPGGAAFQVSSQGEGALKDAGGVGVLRVELGRNVGRLLVWEEAISLSDFKASDRVATCQTHGCGADHVLATCIS